MTAKVYVEATYSDIRRGWLVVLPSGVSMEVRSAGDAIELRDRHAPGTVIRWHRDAVVPESELRALWGDR